MNARRATLVVAMVIAVLAAVAPVLILQKAAANRTGDPAYRALAVYALANNGDRSLDARAAEILPTLHHMELGPGRTQLSRASSDGRTCWVVVVEDGRAQPPRKGVSSDCSRTPTP